LCPSRSGTMSFSDKGTPAFIPPICDQQLVSS
jgi:hypothetical protein